MIAKVLVSSKPPTVGLRPVGDSLPRTTWREAAGWITPDRARSHRYPTEGCHGAPLERVLCEACPLCIADCDVCGGTMWVPVDHPNRTDGP